MQFFLPVKPLSANKLWQGRRFKTPEYLAYERELWAFTPRRQVAGEVELTVEFFVANRRADTDNMLKGLLDVLTKMGVYEDDSMIMSLHAHKIIGDKEHTPGMRITITPYT